MGIKGAHGVNKIKPTAGSYSSYEAQLAFSLPLNSHAASVASTLTPGALGTGLGALSIPPAPTKE
jgi:hypothetical protein